MEQVTLRTENGKWSHVLQGVEDPFHELVESMREVGTVSDEIVLTSSVAEVVEAEWPAYLRLVEWLTYGREDSPRHSRCGEPSYLTPKMMRMATIHLHQGHSSGLNYAERWGTIESFRRTESDLLPPSHPVYLREVYQLSRILSFPKGWRECVAVGKDDLTFSQRVEYLQEAAEGGCSADFGSGIPLVSSLWNLIYSATEEGGVNGDAYYAFSAVVRSALIASHQSEGTVLDWSTILWKELRELYVKILPSDVLPQVLVILDDFTSASPSCPIRIPPNHFGYRSDLIILDVPSWRKLYDAALLNFPKDIHPYSLGLHCILDAEPQFTLDPQTTAMPAMGDAPGTHFGRGLLIRDLVAWLHHTLMTFVSSNRVYYSGHAKWSNSSIPRSQFSVVVEAIGSVLGKETLVRMKDSLKHYLETRESGRASSFVQAIEDCERGESQRPLADLIDGTLLECRRKYYETL